jgi:hypothetical protein
VWRALRTDRCASYALLLAVGLAVVAVGMDSIDPSTWTIHAERVEQTAEEAIEFASGLAFLAAIALRLLGLLDAMAGTPGPSPGSDHDMTPQPTRARTLSDP